MTPAGKRIYDYLVPFARKAKRCPTNEDISIALNTSTSCVSIELKRLIKEGVIQAEHKANGKRRIYLVATELLTGWTLRKNEMGGSAGLTERKCLNCGEMFASSWVGNRICGPCRGSHKFETSGSVFLT